MPQRLRPWRVLVVDGDSSTRSMLRQALQAHGHEVVEAADGRHALTLAAAGQVGLCLLDPALPDVDGMALIPRLRAQMSAPIVVLASRAQEWQQVRALDAGADDYVAKPLRMEVLQARLRALQRRTGIVETGQPRHWRLGDVSVDLQRQTVHRCGQPLPLTGTQWRLLVALCRRAGQPAAPQQLLREVWGPEHAGHLHYLRVYVHRLRQALEPDPGHPVFIIREPGRGYRLMATPADPGVDAQTGLAGDGRA